MIRADTPFDGDPELPSATSRRVAEARARFRSIILPHPRQAEMHAALDELRLTGLACAGRPQGGVRLLAPSGSGKTSGAQLFKSHVLATGTYDPSDQPIVIATLETAGTVKSVPGAILTAMGEGRADRGHEPMLWLRVQDAMRRANTEMLIVDEIDRATRRPSLSSHIAGALRDLCDSGIVPVAFIGTAAAADLFRHCQDLDQRLDCPVTMEPLDMLVEEDREIQQTLVEGFDNALVTCGALPSWSDLGQQAMMLAEASNGILRQLSRIIETAMIHVVRRHGDSIEVDDLANAVDDWSIAKGLLDHNPFR